MTTFNTTRAGDEPDPLAIAILWDGYYSDNYLGSVDGQGWELASSPAEVKRRVLEAVAWLLDHQLLTLFTVDTRRPAGEVKRACSGTTEDLIAWLETVYTNDSDDEDWHSWAYACWFENTEAGDALAEKHPPEPWGDEAEQPRQPAAVDPAAIDPAERARRIKAAVERMRRVTRFPDGTLRPRAGYGLEDDE